MIDNKIMQNEIRTLFLHSNKQTINHAMDGLLEKVAYQLQTILDASFCGFYLYDEWHRGYNLISKQNQGLVNRERFDLNPSNKNITYQYDTYIFTFNTLDQNKSSYFVMQINADPISEKLLDYIYEEIEQFLQIFSYMNESKWENERNEKLNNLSTKIFSTPNRPRVLQLIVDHLYKVYPTFTYYILLSQDYEENCLLPIKALDFNQGNCRVSEEAYVSGEIQVEKRTEGSYLYAPLKGNQGVYGVLQMIAPSDVSFPEKEVNYIAELTQTVGQALENVTLYQHSRKRVSDLQLINHVTQQLNANVELKKLITIVKQHIIEASHADEVGFIFINEGNAGQLDVSQESTDFFNTEKGSFLASYLIEKIGVKGEFFTGNFTQYYPQANYESVMFVPMIQSGKILGGIAMMHKEKYHFSLDNFKLMQSLIQHFTLAITNTILKNKLEKAVITDYLTKLYARNYLDDMIKNHMESDEYGTLVLFDIDDFKDTNDTYGHFIGDEVIIQVANIMRTNIRKGDIPTRWGGEELAIYLPHTTLKEGLKVAERIRKQVEDESEPQVTLSCGISTWANDKDDAVSDLFVRADKALYVAKEAGKNQVATELEI